MTLLVPTPEAFVVAPGDVEESVGRLYDCLQGDQELRSSMLPGMKSNLSESRWSREEIDFLFEDRRDLSRLFPLGWQRKTLITLSCCPHLGK